MIEQTDEGLRIAIRDDIKCWIINPAGFPHPHFQSLTDSLWCAYGCRMQCFAGFHDFVQWCEEAYADIRNRYWRVARG